MLEGETKLNDVNLFLEYYASFGDMSYNSGRGGGEQCAINGKMNEGMFGWLAVIFFPNLFGCWIVG